LLRELEERASHRQRCLVSGHPGEALAHANTFRQIFTVALVQQRFVIEQIELRRSTGHEQANDAPGFGGEMGLRENSFERICRLRGRGREQIALQKSDQCHAAEAQAKSPEELTAIHAEVDLPAVHSRYTRTMLPPFTAKKTSSLTHSIGARPVK